MKAGHAIYRQPIQPKNAYRERGRLYSRQIVSTWFFCPRSGSQPSGSSNGSTCIYRLPRSSSRMRKGQHQKHGGESTSYNLVGPGTRMRPGEREGERGREGAATCRFDALTWPSPFIRQRGARDLPYRISFSCSSLFKFTQSHEITSRDWVCTTFRSKRLQRADMHDLSDLRFQV